MDCIGGDHVQVYVRGRVRARSLPQEHEQHLSLTIQALLSIFLNYLKNLFTELRVLKRTYLPPELRHRMAQANLKFVFANHDGTTP